MNLVARCVGFFAAVAFMTAAHAQPPTTLAVQPNPTAYEVGPGDILKITVYRAPTYDTIAQVADDGSITLSVIGKVQVRDLTPDRVAQAVARELKVKGIFIDPIVNVLVQEYRSKTITIIGNVGKPGEYALDRQGLRITEMLARAGASLGVGGGMIRIMKANGQQFEIPAYAVLGGQQDRVLESHDTIVVTETNTFYISGEIQRSGSYPLEPGLTLGRAIALAGGLSARGSRNKLKVTRVMGDGKEKVVRLKPGDLVQPKDLIVVGARIF